MATLHNTIKLTLFLTILISFHHSNAKQLQPTLGFFEINQILNQTSLWRNQTKYNFYQSMKPTLNLASPMLTSGVLCFIAASISSAGGIGGGGLYIPILTIVSGLDLKTASGFSSFMVTGGSLANVMCNLISQKFGGKALIDYDIALLSEPCMLLGVSIGVICNLIFPEWLITTLFVVFLVWSTFKTCKNGVLHWNLESEEEKIRRRNCDEQIENGIVKNGIGIGNENENEIIKSLSEPLLEMEKRNSFSWEKLGMLILIWSSFSLVYLLRGNRYGDGISPLKPCGLGYWILSSFQIPLAIIFTTWILLKKRNYHNQISNSQVSTKDIDVSAKVRSPNKLMFPLMALLAGSLGGVFGIGGGMLISPLLLHIGIPPQVTAATCSFMVFFSSTMSAFQYLLSGMEHTEMALIFALICFIASLVGILVVQKTIQEYGRASIIVFSVGVVMALSTILITSFGAFDVWRDLQTGTNMGFKLPC